MSEPDVRSKAVSKDTTRCPYCHEGCATEDATVCDRCQAPHHPDCWTAGQGCGTCGPFTRVPADAPRPRAAPAAPAPLTLDLARETLVRAGHSLREVDEVLGAQSRIGVGAWAGAGRGFTVVLCLLAIVLGALGAGNLAPLLDGRQINYSDLQLGAGCSVAAAIALLLALFRR